MAKHRQFTIEEYDNIGASLLVIKNFLITLQIEIASRHNITKSPSAKVAKAIKYLDETRSFLENEFFSLENNPDFIERFGSKRNPEGGERSPLNIFYGNHIFAQREPIGLKFLKEYKTHFKESNRLQFEEMLRQERSKYSR